MNTLLRKIVCICVLSSLAAPLLANPSLPSVTGADIGRLFMSPADRSRIDSQRARGVTDDVGVQSDTPTVAPEQIVMNGWVKRGNAVNAVWVNGETLEPGARTNENVVILRGPGRDKSVVIGRGNGRRAVVKPGQSWDLSSDTVEECADCNAEDSLQVKPEISPELDAETAVAGG